MLRNSLPASLADLAVPVRARALPIGYAARGPYRSAASVVVGCMAFLWTYAALHLAHTLGYDVPLVRAIAPIPLFAIFITSAAVGALSAVPMTRLIILGGRRLTSLPTALLFSIAVFSASVVLFP
jgi:hypothetical protein